jgi:hypothetical protein
MRQIRDPRPAASSSFATKVDVGITAACFAPILFGLALHGRCVRVLEREPVPGAAGRIARVQARFDTMPS